MGNENGVWIMHGISESDPYRIKSPDELIERVLQIGFLPLFKNTLPGFSVEEMTASEGWWSDDMTRDPWRWREIAASTGKVAYGKFFNKKAGFVSPEYLPYLANYRRLGYDFDARWEDALAHHRSKLIMDKFSEGTELFSYKIKELCGFGIDGIKNFEGAITELQMQTYLVVRDFRKRLNKFGQPYGWPIAVYSRPEDIWGYECVTSAYCEEPEKSFDRITEKILTSFPNVDKSALKKVVK